MTRLKATLNGFTHRARFYGVPCYFRSDGEGCDLVGANCICDLLIEYVCPWIHWLCESVGYVVLGVDYEPSDWRIEIVEKL